MVGVNHLRGWWTRCLTLGIKRDHALRTIDFKLFPGVVNVFASKIWNEVNI